jgi:murein DD-endopeptidase MepM/ murein hydrolase activator NlpD
MTDTHSHPKEKHYLINTVFLFCCLVLFFINGKGNVEQEFYSPFNDANRESFQAIQRRVAGSYGEYRTSYKPGHLHAGIDLEGSFRETIYAVGKGQVHLIFREFPHQSVIVRHQPKEDHLFYSVYTHVEQVKVNVGDWVDEKTPLARLFAQDELERANFGTPNHLHFEIRKSLEDDGRASYASMTRQELDTFCRDPLEFFKAHLAN